MSQKNGYASKGTVHDPEYVWNGNSGTGRSFIDVKRSFELNFRSIGVFNIVTGVEVRPVATHGERRTLDTYVFQADPNNQGLVRTALQTNAAGNANTELQGEVALLKHLEVSGWEKRQSEFRADNKAFDDKVARVFNIFQNRLGLQALSLVEEEMTAQDPVATWIKLQTCARPTASQALGSAHHDLQVLTWHDGTLQELQGSIARLEQTILSYPGETLPSEAARIAQLLLIVGGPQAPIFKGTIDRLRSGKEDGTSFNLERVWADLKLVETSAADGKVWNYRKAHLSEYSDHLVKAGGSTGGKLKGSYMAALVEDSDDDEPPSETDSEKVPPAKKGGGNKWDQKRDSGPRCPICQGAHRVRQCDNCKECPGCGWRYAKSTRGACPGPYHSSGKRAQGSKGSRGTKHGSASTASGGADLIAMAAAIERLTQGMEDLQQELDERSAF
jgi:hypothetical protein